MVTEQKSNLILPDPACWPGVHSRTRGGSPCEMCANRFVKVAWFQPRGGFRPPFTLSLPSSLPVSRKSAPRHQLSPWTDGCCSCLLLPPPLSSLSDSIPRPAASSPLPHATSTCPHLALLLPLDHCSRTRSAPATLPSRPSLPRPPNAPLDKQSRASSSPLFAQQLSLSPPRPQPSTMSATDDRSESVYMAKLAEQVSLLPGARAIGKGAGALGRSRTPFSPARFLQATVSLTLCRLVSSRLSATTRSVPMSFFLGWRVGVPLSLPTDVF